MCAVLVFKLCKDVVLECIKMRAACDAAAAAARA